MYPPLNALDLTLKLHEVGQPDTLQMEVTECLRDANFDLNQLAGWASRALLEFGIEKEKDRRALNRLDQELLSYIGLSRMTFFIAQEANKEEMLMGFYRKR